jgi:hypothetical protein
MGYAQSRACRFMAARYNYGKVEEANQSINQMPKRYQLVEHGGMSYLAPRRWTANDYVILGLAVAVVAGVIAVAVLYW